MTGPMFPSGMNLGAELFVPRSPFCHMSLAGRMTGMTAQAWIPAAWAYR